MIHVHEQRRYMQYVCPSYLPVPDVYKICNAPWAQNSGGLINMRDQEDLEQVC